MSLMARLGQSFIACYFILLQGSQAGGQAGEVRDFTLTDRIGWPVIAGAIVLLTLLVFAATVLFKRKRKN